MLQLGILKTWNSTTYKAGVQLVGSLTTYLDDISVATNISSSAMVVGNYVLVAIPGGNPRDACVVASWPAGSSGAGGGFASKARAYVNAVTFTIANNTWTKVALNAKNFDGLGEFDTTTYKFTAQAAGYYLIMGRTQCHGNSVDGQYVGVAIFLKGARYGDMYQLAAAAGKYVPAEFLDVVYLAANDYLELYAWQTSGAAQAFSGFTVATNLVVCRLS
jgi:hypothetical protein